MSFYGNEQRHVQPGLTLHNLCALRRTNIHLRPRFLRATTLFSSPCGTPQVHKTTWNNWLHPSPRRIYCLACIDISALHKLPRMQMRVCPLPVLNSRPNLEEIHTYTPDLSVCRVAIDKKRCNSEGRLSLSRKNRSYGPDALHTLTQWASALTLGPTRRGVWFGVLC